MTDLNIDIPRLTYTGTIQSINDIMLIRQQTYGGFASTKQNEYSSLKAFLVSAAYL